MKNELDILKRIQKVDAPPFLYTRILNRVQNTVKQTVSVKWVVTAVACLVVLFIINIMVIQSNKTNSKADLTEVFSLKTNYNLYDE